MYDYIKIVVYNSYRSSVCAYQVPYISWRRARGQRGQTGKNPSSGVEYNYVMMWYIDVL